MKNIDRDERACELAVSGINRLPLYSLCVDAPG